MTSLSSRKSLSRSDGSALSCGAPRNAALLLVSIAYRVAPCMCQLCTYAWTYISVTCVNRSIRNPVLRHSCRPQCTHMHWTRAPKCYTYHRKSVRIHGIAAYCLINRIRIALVVYVSDMPMHSYLTPLYCLMHAFRIYRISYSTQLCAS